MEKLEISLLGGFGLKINGKPLCVFISDKGRALLAYLAMDANRPHRREALASLLWPDQPDSTARANLRQALHRLQHAFRTPSSEIPCLQVTSQDIQFNINGSCWLDIIEFSDLLAASQRHHPRGKLQCEDCLRNLHAAAALYHGDLLAGLSLSGCSDFEWWLSCRREEYHAKAIETLNSLISHYEQEQDFFQASQYAQQAIELEPWSEFYHRQKMRDLAFSGRRNAARRQYDVCRMIIARELGGEPSAETTSLYHRICDGSLQVG